MKKVFFILTVLFLISCRGGQKEPQSEETSPPLAKEAVTIELWVHTGGEINEVRESINRFNEANADINVKVVALPEATYTEQVDAALFGAGIAGDLPDILDFDGPNIYNYVWKGILIPLDGYITQEMRDDILPSILNQGTYQDKKLYSLGQFDSGLAIWGNRKYLDQAGIPIPTVENPWSRQDFEEALSKLQAIPEVEYALDMKMNYGIGEWFTYGFSPILQSFGADLIDRRNYQSAEGVLNGPQAMAAMQMVQEWFNKGYVNAYTTSDSDFIEGKSALSWVGFWVSKDYIAALGDDLVLIPMPDFGYGPKTGMGSWSWGITSRCENPDAAWRVLEFLLSPEEILSVTNANGSIPSRISAIENSEFYKEGGLLNLYIQQIQAGFAVPRPITPAYPTITKAFSEAFNNITRGKDIETELDLAVQQIDRDIKEHQGYR